MLMITYCNCRTLMRVFSISFLLIANVCETLGSTQTGKELPLEALQNVEYVHFGYKTIPDDTAHGEIWMDLKRRLFRLTGFKQNTQFGDSQVSIIIDGEKRKVYTSFQAGQNEQQCISYAYPESALRAQNHLESTLIPHLHDGTALQKVNEGDRVTNPNKSIRVHWMRNNEIVLTENMNKDVQPTGGVSERLTEVKIVKHSNGNYNQDSLNNDNVVKRGYKVIGYQTHWPDESTFDPPFLPLLDPDSWNCQRYEPTLHQQKLANFGLGSAIEERSQALIDLAGAIGTRDRDAMLLAGLALPGDLTILLQEPTAPDFSFYRKLYLQFKSQILHKNIPSSAVSTSQSETQDTLAPSNGKLWLDVTKRSLKLEAEFNTVRKVTVLLDGSLSQSGNSLSTGGLYTNLELRYDKQKMLSQKLGSSDIDSDTMMSNAAISSLTHGIGYDESTGSRPENLVVKSICAKEVLDIPQLNGEERSSLSSKYSSFDSYYQDLSENHHGIGGNVAGNAALSYSKILHDILEIKSDLWKFRYAATLHDIHDCLVFETILPRKRTLKIWVENDGIEPRIWQIEVTFPDGSTVLRTEVLQFVTEEMEGYDKYGKKSHHLSMENSFDSLTFSPPDDWNCKNYRHEMKILQSQGVALPMEYEKNKEERKYVLQAHRRSLALNDAIVALEAIGKKDSWKSASSVEKNSVYDTGTSYDGSIPGQDSYQEPKTVSESSYNSGTTASDTSSYSNPNIGYQSSYQSQTKHVDTGVDEYETGSYDDYSDGKFSSDSQQSASDVSGSWDAPDYATYSAADYHSTPISHPNTQTGPDYSGTPIKGTSPISNRGKSSSSHVVSSEALPEETAAYHYGGADSTADYTSYDQKVEDEKREDRIGHDDFADDGSYDNTFWMEEPITKRRRMLSKRSLMDMNAIYEYKYPESRIPKEVTPGVLLATILALPGELQLLHQEPKPPAFNKIQRLEFDYEATTAVSRHHHSRAKSKYEGSSSYVGYAKSSGHFAMIVPDGVMRLTANSNPSTKFLGGDFGDVSATFLVRTLENECITEVAWTEPSHSAQCMIDTIPTATTEDNARLENQAKQVEEFISTVEMKDSSLDSGTREVNLFQLSMSHGRFVQMYVTRGGKLLKMTQFKGRHPERPFSTVVFKNWKDDSSVYGAGFQFSGVQNGGNDGPAGSRLFRPDPEWHCRKAKNTEVTVALDDPDTVTKSSENLMPGHMRSIAFKDSLFSLSNSLGQYHMLYIPTLSLTGELDLLVNRPTGLTRNQLKRFQIAFRGVGKEVSNAQGGGLFGSYGSGTSERVTYSGKLFVDFDNKRIMLTGHAESGSAWGDTAVRMIIDGVQSQVYVQLSRKSDNGRKSHYCFRYPLGAKSNLEESFTEHDFSSSGVNSNSNLLHFLGIESVKNQHTGREQEAYAYDLNLPRGGHSLGGQLIKIFISVEDGEVIKVEEKINTAVNGQEIESISFTPTNWNDFSESYAESHRFGIPSSSCVEASEDLYSLLSPSVLSASDHEFPSTGIADLVLRSLKNLSSPPLFLIGLPLEYPHIAEHLIKLCNSGSTQSCDTFLTNNNLLNHDVKSVETQQSVYTEDSNIGQHNSNHQTHKTSHYHSSEIHRPNQDPHSFARPGYKAIGPLADTILAKPFSFKFRSRKESESSVSTMTSSSEISTSSGTLFVDPNSDWLYLDSSSDTVLSDSFPGAKQIRSQLLVHGEIAFSRLQTSMGARCVRFGLADYDSVANGDSENTAHDLSERDLVPLSTARSAYGLSHAREVEASSRFDEERIFHAMNGFQIFLNQKLTRMKKILLKKKKVKVEIEQSSWENDSHLILKKMRTIAREAETKWNCEKQNRVFDRKHWDLVDLLLN